MALKICNECGNKISETAVACPKCGAPSEVALKNPNLQKMHWSYWLVFIFLGLLLLFLIIGVASRESTGGTDKEIEQRAFKKCIAYLKDSKSAGYPEGVLLNQGQQCEALRQDFRMKWKTEP